MSVKAMAMVWDLECPKEYNGIEFRPSHKFTLLAYADHADHHGKNIFPAVLTVSKKTGLDERTTQRLTRDLTAMGIMVPDGQGPRGTNRFLLAYDDRGWHPVTLSGSQGDKSQNSLGDNSSGDIPSGDNVTPEFKEPEPNDSNLKDSLLKKIELHAVSAIPDWKVWNRIKNRIEEDSIFIVTEGEKIIISGLSERKGQFTEAQIWTAKYCKSFANTGLQLEFRE